MTVPTPTQIDMPEPKASTIDAGSASASHKSDLEAAREAALAARADELEAAAQAAELAQWESAPEHKVRTRLLTLLCLCVLSRLLLHVFAF